MHKKLLFAFLILIFNTQAQRWVDSIEMARSFYKKKDFGQAISIYERNPDKSENKQNLEEELAQSYYRHREFDKAKSHYDSALKKTKGKLKKSKIHHNIGNSKFKKKDYDGAIESYKNSLRINPNDEETRYNLSEAIRRKNKKDQKNKPKKDSPKNKNDNNKNKNPKSNPSQNTPKKLPNKKVDKMLDELAKQESRTKRRMQKGSHSKSSKNSKKDW